MNRRVAVTVLIGGILLIATPCYAHSLHPVFWGLGPLAPLLMIGSVVGCLPLIAIIAGQALLLHRFIPATFLGSLWRAAVIFALSKVAETLPAFINTDVFFGYVPPAKFTLIVVLMVVAAVVANAVLKARAGLHRRWHSRCRQHASIQSDPPTRGTARSSWHGARLP